MMEKFDRSDYESFVPKAAIFGGRRLITRAGVPLFDTYWTPKSMYKNKTVQLRSLLVALGSATRRGRRLLDSKDLFGIIHSIWTAGYYHWVTESLPRALALKDAFPKAIPLLPSRKYCGYVDSLSALGFEKVEFFPEGENVLVDRCVMTSCPADFATTDPYWLIRVRDQVWTGLGVDPSRSANKIIYVSRRKARGRFVINEDEVSSFFEKIGAEIVCFEDLDFAQQIRLMSQTKMLVSIHGAALTNMLFMPPGGRVVEFIPRKNGIVDYSFARKSFNHDACYVRLSEVAGHDYRYLDCESDVRWLEKTHMANIRVEIDVLSRAIGFN